jgi:hypothetical protein
MVIVIPPASKSVRFKPNAVTEDENAMNVLEEPVAPRSVSRYR